MATRRRSTWITAIFLLGAVPALTIGAWLTSDSWFQETAIVQTIPNVVPASTHSAIADLDLDTYPEIISGLETTVDGVPAILITVSKGKAVGQWHDPEIAWAQAIGGTNIALADILVGDVNDDYWLDVVVKCRNSDLSATTYYTLINSSNGTLRCAGDIDADGVTQMPDLLQLLEDWGCAQTLRPR